MNDEMNRQSAEWFARLRSGDASDDELERHDHWLNESDEHRAAYNRLEREWEGLDDLGPWAGEELKRLEAQFSSRNGEERDRRHKRWFSYLGWGGMAAAAVVVFAVLVLLPAMDGTDSFRTLKGEQRRIVLEDGSRAHLNSASTLQVHYTRDEREITLLKGEVLFDVVKDPSRPFVVKARESQVIAVGTTFSVYYNDGDIDITVVEGEVAVLPVTVPARRFIKKLEPGIGKAPPGSKQTAQNRNGSQPEQEPVLIRSDRQVKVDSAGQVSEPRVVDASKLTSWERGMLVLDGMPLRDVAREISRYVPGEVQVAANVPDYPVTGVIRIRDRATMLQLLSQVVPVTAVRQSARVTLLYDAADKADSPE